MTSADMLRSTTSNVRIASTYLGVRFAEDIA
jgi:hypothetical protein